MTQPGAVMLCAALTSTLWAQAPADSPAAGDGLHPRYRMETSLGNFVLELDAERAPITVMNFHRYVQDEFYDHTVFHRVRKGFMIQGGGFTAELDNKTDGLREGIENEWQNGLKNVRGTIAMARLGWSPRMPEQRKIETANSATSQFFINVTDNLRLDRPQKDGAAYTVFGKVVEGMETVDAIRNVPVHTHAKLPSFRNAVPVEPVVIKSIRLISEFDETQAQARAKEAKEAYWAAVEEQKKAAEAARQEVLANIEAAQKNGRTTQSGLKYLVLQEGTGPSPDPTDRVTVHYTGWLLDGTKFDSSYDHPGGKPATFRLNGVIDGWTEGVGMMKVGGKRRFVIPPNLAYGARGFRPKIGPDETLCFDVELIAIEPPPQRAPDSGP